MTAPEPWLRGPLPSVDPLLAPTIHALQQTKEDIHKHTSGLNDEQIWSRPYGLTSLGFHLRHVAGSLDRLTTYLQDQPLTEEQLQFLGAETTPGASLAELLAAVDAAIQKTSQTVRAVSLDSLREPRFVGRKRLPTTVIGLVVHLAEHTLRHVGQVVTLSCLLKALQKNA